MADLEKLQKLKSLGRISEQDFEDEKHRLAARKLRRGANSASKNGILYILLAWFVGTLGLHNFYAGYYWRGIIQLVLTLVAWMFMFVPLLFVAIWVLLELLFVNRDAKGVPFHGSCVIMSILRILSVILLGLAFSYNTRVLPDQDLAINENLESFLIPEE